MQPKVVLGLLAVALLLLLGVTAYFVGNRSEFSIPLSYGARDTKQNAKAEKPAADSSSAKEAAKPKARLSRKPIREAVEAGLFAAPANGVLETRLALPEGQRPFPTANQIPTGMRRAELEAIFEPPTIKAVKVDQGRLFETYVYLGGDSDVATFARLQNGRVVSAQTISR